MRTPSAMFFGAGPTHGAWLGVPLRSATIGSPTESAAAMNARSAGAMSRSATRNTGTGPLVPASGPAQWIGLRALEVRQHIPEAPTGIAEVRPAVVVGGGATQPDATVHCGRSPDDPRAREGEGIVGLSPGEGVSPAVGVRPDVCGIEQIGRPGGGIGAVIGPGLQQQNGAIAVLGQPVGEDAPGRARSDKDRVVLGKLVHVITSVLVPRSFDLIDTIIRPGWNRRSARSVDKAWTPF